MPAIVRPIVNSLIPEDKTLGLGSSRLNLFGRLGILPVSCATRLQQLETFAVFLYQGRRHKTGKIVLRMRAVSESDLYFET